MPSAKKKINLYHNLEPAKPELKVAKEPHIKSKIEPTAPTHKLIKFRRRTKNYLPPDQRLIVRQEGFKLKNVIVLVLIGVFALSALSLSYKASRFEIRPLIPENQATLNSSDIEFCWASSAENVNYLIQVETNGKRILEKCTLENRYVPTLEEMKLFKPGNRYQWRVVPISAKRRHFAFKTDDREFKVAFAQDK